MADEDFGDINEFSVSGVSHRIVFALVQVIMIAQVLIPLTVDMAKGTGTHVGDTWDYDVETNIPQVIGIGGTQQQYATFEDNHIHIEWTELGDYTLVIKATSSKPYQETTKIITFSVVPQSQYEPLILIIPTMVIMGIVISLVRTMKSNNYDNYGGGGGFGGYGGGDISGRL